MTTRESRNEILEFMYRSGIEGGVRKIFGNWAVSTKGDIVNCKADYVIYTSQIRDMDDAQDWMEQIASKRQDLFNLDDFRDAVDLVLYEKEKL